MEIRALLSAMWRSRTGPLLVAAQVAITLAVVVNVAYIIQQRLENIARPIGLDVDNMFWVQSQSFGRDYNHVATIESDLDYLQRLPGVVAAASTANIPQGFGSSVLAFATTQEELDKGGGTPATVFFGSARYIETLGVKLSAGRGFDPAATMPSADSYRQMMGNWSSEIVITKNLADKLWPKGDALGKTLYTGLVNKPATIVGIIEHFQHQPVQGRARDLFQTAVMATALSPPPVITYMIRAKPGQRDALMARVEKEFADRNPGRFIRSMEAFTDTVRRTRAECAFQRDHVERRGGVRRRASRWWASLGSRRSPWRLARSSSGRDGRSARRSSTSCRYFLVENWLDHVDGRDRRVCAGVGRWDQAQSAV